MTKTIVLVHGLWVTRDSWTDFRKPFEAAGYTTHTPTWSIFEGKTAAELNKSPPADLGKMRVGKVVDEMSAFIRTLPEKPLLIGHSFGGLYVQMLLDRGLGAGAVDPAPIGGIVAGPRSLVSALPAIARWNGWNRSYALTREAFAYRFANAAPPALQNSAYDSYVIPTPGGMFYQAASWLGTFVKPKRRTQPLLITAGDKDRLVTPYLSRAAYHIRKKSPAPTDYKLFPGRSHLLLAEPGWEAISGHILDWAKQRL